MSEENAKLWRPKIKAAKHSRSRKIRLAVQSLFFLGFIGQGLAYYLLDFRPLGNLLPFMAYESLGHMTVSSALLAWGAIFFLTFVFGRFVCGWLCPIGFLQDAGEKILRALKIPLPKPVRQSRIPRYLLAGMILVQFIALPLLASPLRIWQFDLNFQQPWLLGFPFRTALFVLDLLAIFLVTGVILPLYFGSRPYCRLVCETGLLLDRVSQFSFGRIRRNEGFDRNTCISCNKCSNTCLQGIDVSGEVHLFDQVVNPDCIGCLECVNICPNDTVVYSLRKRIKDAGKVSGYLSQMRMKPEDLPRYLFTGLGVVLGGYIGFMKLPPSYFHTYLLLSASGGLLGWFLWKALSLLWGPKKMEDLLKEKALSQVERETAQGLAPLPNRDKLAYDEKRPSRKWVGAGVVMSCLVLGSVFIAIYNKVPPRIVTIDEIEKEGSSPEERMKKSVLHFGIPPVYSQDRLQVAYGPLQHYLQKRMGGEVRLVTAPSYGALTTAFRQGRLDAVLLPPMAYLSLRRQIELGADRTVQTEDLGQTRYTGLLIASDPGLTEISQLRGKRIAFTSLDSLSGYVAPMALIASRGLKPVDFSEVTLAGDHSKSLQLLADGGTDAVATYESAWRTFRKTHPDVSMHVLERIPNLPSDVVVIHPEVSPARGNRLVELLLAMKSNGQGREVLENLGQVGVSGFDSFDGSGYEDLERFVGDSL